MNRRRVPKLTATLTLARRLRLAFAAHNANRHIKAWMLDRDPRHVVDAYLAYRKMLPNEAPPLELLVALDAALAELRKGVSVRRGKRGRPNLVEDLELARLAEALASKKSPVRPAMNRTEAAAHVGAGRGLKRSAAIRRYERIKALEKLHHKK